MDFGKKLSLLRKIKNFTQRKLADKTHINMRLIQKYEHNTCSPKEENLKKIMEVLNVPNSYFSEFNTETASDIIKILLTFDSEVAFSIIKNPLTGRSAIEFKNPEIENFISELQIQRNELAYNHITLAEYEAWKKEYIDTSVTNDTFVSKTLLNLLEEKKMAHFTSPNIYPESEMPKSFD